MKNMKLLKGSLALFFWAWIGACMGVIQTGAAEKPNIVYILADDVGQEVLGCYGGESYPTPHLDRLAAGGMRFRHAYAMPVCHPTRVTLLTGQYPFRLSQPSWGSFPEQAEDRTVAQVLGNAGYATAVAGKWQLTLLGENPDHPKELGFDEWCLYGWHEGPRYYEPLIWENGEKSKRERYGPDIYCDFLIDFMEKNHARPFFAFYSMTLCHAVGDDLEDPVPFAPGKDRYDSYAEMVRAMDLRVGRIMETLNRLGLDRRTLVVFTTDNGTPGSLITDAQDGNLIREPVHSMRWGRKIRGGKGALTDAGTRVPMIASWPGTIEGGQIVDDLVDMSDYLPTFAELAGTPLPDGVELDGRSFAPLLKGTGSGYRDWVYVGRGDRYYVRDQRWKLYDDGKLYHMRADPGENNAIALQEQSSDAANARQRLSRVLHELRENRR